MIDKCNPNAGRDEGRRRKDAAHLLLEARREVYVRHGRHALLEKLLKNGTATPDDVRAAVALPEGIDPVCLGSVPGTLATKGIIERTGYVDSTRPEAHGRPVSVWRLRDRRAAEHWLLTHPPLTDPAKPAQRDLFPNENCPTGDDRRADNQNPQA